MTTVEEIVEKIESDYGRAGRVWPNQSSTVVIGAKPFTEQIILGQLIAQHVRARLGLATEVKESLGSTIAFDALVSNQIDVYVDYSGTVWTNILKRDTGAIDRRTMITVIADELHRESGHERQLGGESPLPILTEEKG